MALFPQSTCVSLLRTEPIDSNSEYYKSYRRVYTILFCSVLFLFFELTSMYQYFFDTIVNDSCIRRNGTASRFLFLIFIIFFLSFCCCCSHQHWGLAVDFSAFVPYSIFFMFVSSLLSHFCVITISFLLDVTLDIYPSFVGSWNDAYQSQERVHHIRVWLQWEFFLSLSLWHAVTCRAPDKRKYEYFTQAIFFFFFFTGQRKTPLTTHNYFFL